MRHLIRKIPLILMLLIAITNWGNSLYPYPYNVYSALIVIIYPVAMEILLLLIPRSKFRLPSIFLFALTAPIWEGYLMSWWFSGSPPITSYDVLLPFLWIFNSSLLLIYAFSVLAIEKFKPM